MPTTFPDLDLDPAPDADPDAAPRRRSLPTFGLSLTQLIATGLAAITATVAASFLGVTGTVIGAALASMTTAAGSAVYGQSLRRGRERVRNAVPVLARATGPDATAARRRVVVPEAVPELPAAPLVRSTIWKRAAIGAMAVFVAVLAVVTGVEVVAGRPISDVVRGDSGSGTSFFGDTQVRTRTATVTPAAPTTTVTVTPKVSYVTPTVTATAPARTQTVTPSATVTATPSATTSTGSTGAGDSASSSASATSSP
ncbi:hypothetical protein [Jatrophihabitans endophyticus]|uniref:hypothetical protein n=1 Tax=Jatrophihabitans endophyticus TaxID=1206085 RepID=UPI001A008DC4|nr:hypothetical protein [Jatrophihabitans endophyticus]MBE7189108.1 hypothetical protein [Jatrophihabitans endophyticus]